MKLRLTILALTTIVLYHPIFAQQWIGEQFTLDTTIECSLKASDSDLSHLKYRINNSTLFYATMRAYQEGKSDHAALIHTLSLSDYTQNDFFLPLPDSLQKDKIRLGTFWINDLYFQDHKAVVSVQDNILLYQEDGQSYRMEAIFHHPRTKYAYLHNQQIYILEEEHDFGYKWFRINPKDGQEEFIMDLPYEAPHVVQANPNRYLFYDEHSLFFLSTRYPKMQQYTLSGEFVREIEFSLPNWHPFDEKYITQSLTIPYGAARIYATMGQIFDYSYPKYVFPFGRDYLLYYTQYDTNRGKSILNYAIIDNTGTHLYSAKASDSTILDGHKFPFNLFQPLEDKLHLSWNDKLIELTIDGGLSWEGKSITTFLQEQELSYEQDEPKLTFRIMHYKNAEANARPCFYDTGHHLQSIDDLSSKKQVILVHEPLECSSCSKELLSLLNNTDSSHLSVGIMYPFTPGALQKRELTKDIQQHLDRPFSLYFLTSSSVSNYPRYIFKETTHYPALLFLNPGEAPILVSLDDIFDDDPTSFNFQKSFLRIWESFLSK